MALAEMLLSGVLALICTMSVVSPLNLSGLQHFFLFLMLALCTAAASQGSGKKPTPMQELPKAAIF
ncbi:hypothetical protein C2E19_23505 [Pseudomonas sp. DTU12.3]|nr:hypothetical protein C2E19_23505 [Pseudomonas sp. DTU12.3]